MDSRKQKSYRKLYLEKLEDKLPLATYLDFGDAPAPYPVTLSDDGARHDSFENWTKIGNDIDGQVEREYFGWSVSLSSDGQILAVGIPESDGNGTDSGCTRVYRWDVWEGIWQPLGEEIYGEETGDWSGKSISLSADGSRVAIGAPFNDGAAVDSGHTRIFQWDADTGTWNQLGTDIDGEETDDGCGESVSLSADGNRVAIGAPFNDDNGEDSGHTRIYQWDAGTATWNQLGTDIDGEVANDQSGRSVSLSGEGNRVAIGAPFNDGNGNGSSGHTRVYAWDDATGSWQPLGTDIDGKAENDHSGWSVSLGDDGNHLAIGSPENDSNNQGFGYTRVYAWDVEVGDWTQLGTDIEVEEWATSSFGNSVSLSADGKRLGVGADPFFEDVAAWVYHWDETTGSWQQQSSNGWSNEGGSVSLSANGNQLAIGSPWRDDQGKDSGLTKVYHWDSFGWGYYENTAIFGDPYGDQSGYSVSLSFDGETVAIGAPRNDDQGRDAGHTRVYTTGGNSWKQLGSAIPGEAEEDGSGYSVSLSSDGQTLAVGAPRNHGIGAFSGHTRVYRWDVDAEDWTQWGADIDGEAAEDGSGYSVSLSADGTTVAIGAPNNDGNGLDSGHTRVYRWDEEAQAWQKLGRDIDGEAEGDFSGWSVSLSSDGNTVGIGAFLNDGNGLDSGSVRTFHWDADKEDWKQLGADIDGEAAGDQSGYSVSLSGDGDLLAIGAPYHDGNGEDSGHTRVYRWEAGINAWTQLGEDLHGEAAGDRSGSAIASVKVDGFPVIALGAPGHGEAGCSRVFQWHGDAGWIQEGLNIVGEAEGDFAGWTVSINGQGNRVAIGAPGNDEMGTDSGQTRVYRISEPRLGHGKDLETDGAPSPNADGDGADEAGVSFGALLTGQTTSVDVNVQGVGGFLDAWVDFNSDGDWLDWGEKVFSNVWLDTGVSHLSFDVPVAATNGVTFSRFRISTAGSSHSTGLREDGEVEDYKVTIYTNNAPTLDPVANCKYDQDASTQTINLAGITDGGEGGQPLMVTATSDQPGLISDPQVLYTSPNETGKLELTPLSDQIGTATITVKVIDGGLDHDFSTLDDNASFTRTFEVNVIPLAFDFGDAPETYPVTREQDGARHDTWKQLGQDIDGEAVDDQSGISVSLSSDGQILAIGAFRNDDNGVDSGHTRIYQWDVATASWTQLGIDIAGEAESDIAGWSVSLSAAGDRVAIGAPNNDGNGNKSGHTRIYQWNAGTATWNQLGSDIDGEAAFDRFGGSVSLSADGTTVAIGAPQNAANGVLKCGHTRVYRWDDGTGNWQQLGSDIDGEAGSDFSGQSVSLSSTGNRVAIGAPGNDEMGTDSGHVRIYHWDVDAEDWTQLGTDIDGEAAGDHSGSSLSLSADGNRVAIGAEDNDGNGVDSGQVRIYHWDAGTGAWAQLGQDIDGEAAFDQFGWGLALDSSGNILASSAYENDGNGPNSGHLRIYHWDSGAETWTQQGKDLNGEKPGDHSGWSVALNADGNTVAVGTGLNDDNGNQSGHVRVYQLPTLWLGRLKDCETEGTPSPSADADGIDEDGVVYGYFIAGQQAELEVTVNGSSGLLDAWVDFNRDGDWLDEGEQIFVSEPVNVGFNLLSFEVPNDADGGVTFTRFRLSSAGGLAPTGLAEDGEVEDVRSVINAAPTLDQPKSFAIVEDSSQQMIVLSGIGDGDLGLQSLSVTATSSNTRVIPDPLVDYRSAATFGTLKFTPVANQSGTTVITVTVEDGGLDQDLSTQRDNATTTRVFRVTVNPVNDVPSFVVPLELDFNESVAGFQFDLSEISPGPLEDQPLEFSISTDNRVFFSDLSIDYSGGTTGIVTFSTAAGELGRGNLIVTLEDGGLDGDLRTPGDNATMRKTIDVAVTAKKRTYALSDQTVFGEIEGTYRDTYWKNQYSQSIKETLFRAYKRSRLEHRWEFDMAGADVSMEFFVNAGHDATNEQFRFQYQVEGSSQWKTLVTTTQNESKQYYTRVVDPELANDGKVIVRVADTVRTDENEQATVTVDRIFFMARRLTNLDEAVNVLVFDPEGAEGGGNKAQFRFQLADRKRLDHDVEVYYELSGTTVNDDYREVLRGSKTIKAGNLMTRLFVTPKSDSLNEGAESVTVRILDAEAYRLTGDPEATVMIHDQDLVTLEAFGEVTIYGSHDLNYEQTFYLDDQWESVTEEIYAGGNRTRLDHRWKFDLAGESEVIFKGRFEMTSEADQDDFQVVYSVDESRWQSLGRVIPGTGMVDLEKAITLPEGTSGVWVRVFDRYRKNGDTTPSTVSIDHLCFERVDSSAMPPVLFFPLVPQMMLGGAKAGRPGDENLFSLLGQADDDLQELLEEQDPKELEGFYRQWQDDDQDSIDFSEWLENRLKILV